MVTVIAAEIMGGERLAGRNLGLDEIGHTVDRCSKRIAMVAEGFQGKVRAMEKTRVDLLFSSLSEASFAAIEIQHRLSDLPPVSGVHLEARMGIHMAETEDTAQSVSVQLMRRAFPKQILCGREILLDQAHSVSLGVRDLLQTQLEDGRNFHVMEVLWREERVPASLVATSVIPVTAFGAENLDDQDFSEVLESSGEMPSVLVPNAGVQSKLCVRHGGKAFLLDEKTPFLTLGREYSNDLVINESRVSRQHAYIERKDNRYYLVDRSTNGTFVAQNGNSEVFLRKGKLLLETSGILTFAVSTNRDDSIKHVEFEFF